VEYDRSELRPDDDDDDEEEEGEASERLTGSVLCTVALVLLMRGFIALR